MTTIIVWFSCGAASAVALQETLRRYPEARVRAVNNPVLEEHPDNRRFLVEVAAHLGVQIETASHPDYQTNSAAEVWRRRRYMSGVRGAPCTEVLKKEVRYLYEERIRPDYHVFGFTVEEKDRHARFVMGERSNVLPVLIEAGLTKADCMQRVESWGIELPHIYSLGYPNANCIGCVKSSSPAYWDLVRRTFPEVFEERARLSREIGCRLLEKSIKGKKHRFFLDELPSSGRFGPVPPAPECGIFCEERG